jgi:transcriptional regulator with XRE-family HTH domain
MKPIQTMGSFGKRLRDIRRFRGLNQTQLAEFIDSNAQVISKYERDEMTPSIDVAIGLAKALKTTAGYLLGEDKFDGDTELEAIFRDLRSVPETELTKIKSALVTWIKGSRVG